MIRHSTCMCYVLCLCLWLPILCGVCLVCTLQQIPNIFCCMAIKVLNLESWIRHLQIIPHTKSHILLFDWNLIGLAYSTVGYKKELHKSGVFSARFAVFSTSPTWRFNATFVMWSRWNPFTVRCGHSQIRSGSHGIVIMFTSHRSVYRTQSRPRIWTDNWFI